MKKVLITGGTGLVGSRLSSLLQEKGYDVAMLSRNPGQKGTIKLYQWDLNKGFIDESAFKDTFAIIHLAGAGVADHRWTNAYKKEILDSRVKSAQLLEKYLNKFKVERLVSASAVGYYGDRGSEWLSETSVAGNSFLADVCLQWENAVNKLQPLVDSLAMIRIGIVLSTKGGALPAMDKTAKLGLGAYLGNGQQFTPWIHIDDLCRMFIFLLEHPEFSGAYNGSAPEPITNKALIKAITVVANKPFIPVPAPALALKLIMGEQADMVLMSNRTSSEKIDKAGFSFQFTHVEAALKDLYKFKN